MKRKTLGTAAALLGAALGLGLLWRALEKPPPSEPPPTAVEAESPARPSPAAEALESGGDASVAAGRSTAEVDRSARSIEHAARTESFALEDAAWITGRVEFPDGAPPDETLEAWAFQTEVAIGLDDAVDDAPALVRAGKLEEGWWSRRAVGSDGTFRLPLPKGTSSAAIVLDGRYLFLDPSVHVGPKDVAEPLRLAPKLGAWLVGRCTLPADAEPSDSPVDVAVSVQGFRGHDTSDGSRGWCQRSTRIGPDLAFEMRGLPADFDSHLAIDPPRLAAAKVQALRLKPGAQRNLEVAFRLGGRASGRVVDEQGAGVPEAELDFRPVSMSGILSFELQVPGEARPRSSADGHFELFGLPSAKSRIRAQHDGFVDGQSDPLGIRDGEVRDGLTIVMPRGHRVSGTVSWPDGSPAAGARVIARVDVPAAEDAQPSLVTLGFPSRGDRQATTDDQGRFTITGLLDGSVAVAATARRATGETPPGQENEPGKNLPVWSAEQKELPAGSADVRLVLAAPVGLAGRVVDDLDRPVTSFEVTANPEETFHRPASMSRNSATQKVIDSADGSFLLAGLQTGSWRIEVAAEGFTQPGSTPVVAMPFDGGPLVVRVERTGSVAGLVLDAGGTPVAGAEVSASRGAGGPFESGEDLGSATTDAHGAFLLGNLRTGSCSLVARKDDQASSEPLSVRIEPEARLEGQVLRLRRGGRLTGEVFDARGAKASERTVHVFGMMGGDSREAPIDDAGTFVIEGLSPGTYQVMLEPTEEDQERMMQGAAEGETNVSEYFAAMKMTSAQIRDGETTHVVLGAPAKAPVRLFGRVTRAGEPVRDGLVTCLREGGPVLSRMKMADVRDTGEYELTLDEPGDIQIRFQADVGSARGPGFFATVPEAPEFRFDLELPTGGIRGIVRGADGRGLPGVPVSARSAGGVGSGWMSVGDVGDPTDAQGRFEFRDLAPGTYAVAAGGQLPFDAVAEPRWGRAIRGGIVVGKDEIVEGVELRVSDPCRITGTVRDAEGSPVVGATVFAWDERGQAVDPLSTCRTDGTGSFAYAGLAPGSYTLGARTRTLASAESAPLVAREGEPSRVELTALPGTTLIVSFEGADGARLHGSISVRDEHGHEMNGVNGIESLESLLSEGLDSSAERIGPLPAGKYQAAATAADGRSAKRTIELRGQEERSVKLRVD